MKLAPRKMRTPPTALAPRRTKSARAGITLMEVLISIFVLSVGLLGLMSLLPISAYYLQDANKNDRASTLGRSALRDLQVRGDLDPRRWRDVGGNPVLQIFTYIHPITGVATEAPAFMVDPNNVEPHRPPFVIDPLAVADPGNVQLQQSPGWCPTSPISGLPVSPPVIRRLTLAGMRPPPTGAGFTPPPNDARWPVAYSRAERIFGGQDDQVYTLPENATLRPRFLGNWGVGPDGAWGASGADDNGNGVTDDASEAGWPGTDDTLQKNPVREYTYLVTVSPTLDAPVDDTAGPTGMIWLPFTSGAMTASVVVFQNRDFAVMGPTQADPPAERMVLVDLPLSDRITVAQLRTNGAANYLNVRRNDWIMLTAWVVDPTYLPNQRRPILNWYRVVHAAADVTPLPPAGGPYQRLVTLEGPDWPVTTSLVNADPPNSFFDPTPGNSVPGITVYATIFKGAIGVYEHSIMLDDPSGLGN